MSGAYPFPGDSVSPDGYQALQSFNNRINGSIGQWDYWARRAPVRPISLVRSDGVGADIFYEYRDVGDILGRAQVTRRSVGTATFSPTFCPVQSTSDYEVVRGYAQISSRGDWFTQEDSMRSTWENCDDATFRGRPENAYLCSKNWDVGSTMAHELGHVLGIHHPHQVSGAANTTAKCANYDDQATMCAVTAAWHSARRTLDGWDIESFNEHHRRHQ